MLRVQLFESSLLFTFDVLIDSFGDTFFCFTSYEFVFLLTSMCFSFLMGMSMFPYIFYVTHVRLLI